MKRYLILITAAILSLPVLAQSGKNYGTCGENVEWAFDNVTLTIRNVDKLGFNAAMADYDLSRNRAPWAKKNLQIRKVVFERGVTSVGSCAFAGCEDIQEVIFNGTELKRIGWGAFYNCSRLRNISLPVQVREIGPIAFANCSSITSVKIPDHCRVGEQAFVSCTGLTYIDCSPTADLGPYAFATQVEVGNTTRHALYNGEVGRLPSNINSGNSNTYGFHRNVVEKRKLQGAASVDYDYVTSPIDSLIPTVQQEARNDTYALIIGNQEYRFVSDVQFAIHDAHVFREYCEKTLGIPAANILPLDNATKQMIMEEGMDWVRDIKNRENKKLIVYYAGHGVPDTRNKNKAYLLPTDVRGTAPQRGIALEDFYGQLGELAFAQTSVFLDACFSGVNRENEGVTEGLRGVEIEPEDATFGDGSVVVFSAAQGNETAQGYPDQGHGLFTYYLLKELRETAGFTNFGKLADNLKKNVSTQALQLKLRKKQTPTTNASEKVAETWRQLSF
ncbi:MAG: leucine-rich repeat protein [Bacteroidaceae bacterium]|nr:leucine-rich repeat protein [Bacteroidaceae bacterium]